MSDQGNERAEYQRDADTTPQPDITELDNGQVIETPQADLAAAKGTLAAHKRARASDDPNSTASPDDLAVPETVAEGITYDEPLLHRAPVFTLDGKRIGSVSDRPSLRDHLIVQQGTLLSSDLYIPRIAIGSRDEAGLHLNVTKDEIERMDWSASPAYD